jgi:hypothetical protein
MADVTIIEQRLAALEADVARLKKGRWDPNENAADWLQRISGSFKDVPEFDEVIRLGREIRQADRPPDQP